MSELQEKAVEEMSVFELMNWVGLPVIINTPQIEGTIAEIIFMAWGCIVFKIKYWIEGEVNYHTMSREEFSFNLKKMDEERKRKAIVMKLRKD